MTAPLDVSGASAQVPPEPTLSGADRAVQGRSLTRIAWMRLRRDKIALAGGITVLLLILMAIFATPIINLFGQDPLEFNQDAIDPNTLLPLGAYGGMGAEHLLGVEPVNGRDIFSRIVAGAGISLLIGFLATIVSVLIGTVMGVVAGYFGGWVDQIIGRIMDVFLAFPLLVFAIALVGVMPNEGFGLEGNGLRIAMLIFIIGFFSWPSIGRIVRGQTLSLREREFVDAARSLGARNGYILFREILPNLMAPILVYATLLIPANILFEAALSFLGVGINPPTPTWGGMLSEAVRFYTLPHFVIFPGLAIFITVLAFNLFGDGLRDAFDPRAH
ncbi:MULTISPECIES: ABC transporter permease [Nonomuraea]|jgi:peptide/nickel transport system permease protein/oligopeptide transport system permease protein|uniref:ABC transporter permease n=2 Tax=Nonomuraea TaxID=83681 RepID=A0ABW1BXB7_9ACTN|nr:MULTISPECIES: ABC transporter permease [Nonomuraea]MDA0645025.1 ABC transporter permease [Nonomuraea ferruginea]